MAEKETKKSNVYVVSKRDSDGKWTVKIKGSDKVIKLFNTKVEAEDYTHAMAANQGRAVDVRNSKGKDKGKITNVTSAKKVAEKKAAKEKAEAEKAAAKPAKKPAKKTGKK